MTDAISIIVAMVGMIVGLAGFLAKRDEKIACDAEWRGSINTMLTTIHQDVGVVSASVATIQTTLADHGERIRAVEESTSSAHKRIDDLKKEA